MPDTRKRRHEVDGLTRRKRAGALAAAVALALLTLVPGTILAADPSLDLDPSQGPRDNGAGTQTLIHLTGDVDGDAGPGGFESVNVYWDVIDGCTDLPWTGSGIFGDGVFDLYVDVPYYEGCGPATLRPGTYSVIVCGSSEFGFCTHYVSANFKVQRPVASLSRTAGREGEPLTVYGSRFSPTPLEELIRFTFGAELIDEDYPPGSTFDYTFDVPDVAPGTYQVTVCNLFYTGKGYECAAKDTVGVPFTVLSPQVSITPPLGLPAAAFSVSGTGFYVGRELHLFFGPAGADPGDPFVYEIAPAVGKATHGDGKFGPYTEAPTYSAGNYAVTACTYAPLVQACDPNDTATAPYAIAAPTASASATPSATPTFAPISTPTLTPTAAATSTPATTSTPGLEPSPGATAQPGSGSIDWPTNLRAPGDAGGLGSPAALGLGGLVAILVSFMILFPATLFNKTVEANYGEIRGWIAGAKRRWDAVLGVVSVGPLGLLRRLLGRVLSGRSGVLIFLALSALVYGFLSPAFGLNTQSAALYLGLLAGLTLTVAAFDLPLRIYHRGRTSARDTGTLRALWWTLLIAIVFVLVSRLASFQPGYLYGLIISVVFVTQLSARDEGFGNWMAAVWLLGLSFAAWFVLTFVRGQALDPWLSLMLQTMLVTFVVAGIETLAIGLLPMRFLPGQPVFKWRRSLWFPAFALAIFGYLLVLMDPVNGYLSDDSLTPLIVGVTFFAIFGLLSLGTWAYFRFRPARPAADQPGEAPSA